MLRDSVFTVLLYLLRYVNDEFVKLCSLFVCLFVCSSRL